MKRKIFLLVSIISFCAFDYKGYDQNLRIKTKDNQTRQFTIKTVTKSEDQEKGLMFVTDLPRDYGMLFDFKDEKMIYMWMKNTKIPLDMLFINKSNQIVSIKENAVPESLEVISSKVPVAKVLEINGGKAGELGIGIGDKINY